MIKLMVIDDSAVVRNAFKNMFAKVSDITLIATAQNPVDAFNEFKRVGLPDVFILDIEMPKMDGLTFLKQINEQRPTPVIMCSTLVSEGSHAAIEALSMGAVGLMHKPTGALSKYFNTYADEFINLVRTASQSKINFNSNISFKKKKVQATPTRSISAKASKKIVAIGASTGGVQAIEKIVLNLKDNHPAVVITQHIPQGFSASFANRLNLIAPHSEVKEAEDGDVLLSGRILIAPGHLHMEVKKEGLSVVTKLKDYPKVNSHKPSVNVLFASMAKEVGARGVGIILTGMGDDGASRLKEMRRHGAKTYAQDEKTCMVYGMPRAAVALDAVDESLSLEGIVDVINKI